MISFPNAKINIGLNIVTKREDGYHNIETIFYPIPVCDILEINPNSNPSMPFALNIIGMEDDGKPNLVKKAYDAFKEHFEVPPISVVLKKLIPFAAGLGGGSSDAAYMLKGLAELYAPDAPTGLLHKMAASIGADCPFFLYNKPLFAEGIGTDFSDIDLSLKGMVLVLIKPNIAISTAEAYSGVTPRLPEFSLREISKIPITEWRGLIKNDFENSLFPKYPALAEVKEGLYKAGAVYASMSGSGSSIYGLFNKNVCSDDLKFLNLSDCSLFIRDL